MADVVAEQPVRPTARRGPYGDGRPEWLDRRGCASAGGSRGSWPGDGCWAERCACSRVSLHCRQLLVWCSLVQSAGRRPAAPANYRSDSFGLSVGLSIGVAVCERPNPIRFTRESAPRITDSTKRPDRADAVQGTDRQAGRSNSRTPGQCRRLFGITRHADGGACRNRGLVGSAGKLLASGSHGSEPPSPPERLFRGAAVSRRRRPLPFPLVHTCG